MQIEPNHLTPDGAYAVRARNIRINTENEIHDDAGARRLGYAGGLVSGVTVYAYLTRPVAEWFGADFLAGTLSRSAFFAPVYEGDELWIEAEPGDLETGIALRARKESGEEVAYLKISRPAALPEPRAVPQSFAREGEARPAFSWEAVVPGEPFRSFRWHPTAEENRAWCESVADDSPLYTADGGGFMHPGCVLQQANRTVGNQFLMTPWIHVSSHVAVHRALRAGDAVEVRAVPREKWEKNGHRYGLLDVAMSVDGAPAWCVEHKVIFQPAGLRTG
ncbi:MAG: hypothetical protein V3T00_00435 [bacterium]